VVYDCAAVMLFRRVVVKSKTAALQHPNTAIPQYRNTKNDTLPLSKQDFDIRISHV
jgi:hypothetical protein